MENTSIIEKPFVEKMLAAARCSYERDGALVPVLFMKFAGEKSTLMPLDLPQTPEARYRYFQALGHSFRKSGKVLTEALLIMEGWYVAVDAQSDLLARPSAHPKRRSAVIVIGRNAAKTAHTSVVQVAPDTTQLPLVWPAPALAAYGSAGPVNPTPVGLLDALFSA